MFAALMLDPQVLNNDRIQDLDLVNQLRASMDLKPLATLDFSLLNGTKEEIRHTLAAVKDDSGTRGGANDPTANWEDAVGRYIPVPSNMVAKARELCRTQEWGGGKVATFKASNVQDMDVVIILHPTQRLIRTPEGERIIDNYVVFARKFSHTWKNKGKSIDIWIPELYYQAWDLEDAEETAKALTSSWEATREQEEEGWGQTELPFSNEFISSLMEKRPGAWTTMSE